MQDYAIARIGLITKLLREPICITVYILVVG